MLNPGATVLVVDDVRSNLIVLETILHKEGIGVLSAASGPEARALARRQRPDLVLLDICMPGEDGLETCARLKQDPLTASIPVIFISDLQDVKNKLKGFELGAVDYITKPFEKAEVLARVRLHLRLSHAHRTLVEDYGSRLRQLSEAQQAILVRPEDHPTASFSVYYHSALEAGGDFYDVVPIGNDLWGYIVADVSGHDLGSSLGTSAVKVAVRCFAGPFYTPGETIHALNDIIRPALPEGHFLTLQYAHLNRRRGRLTLIGLGHPPAVLVRADGGCQILETQGDVLGIFDAITFDSLEVPVSPGDRLFLFTDGLLDGLPHLGWRDGIAALAGIFRNARGLPLSEAVPSIMHCLLPEDGFPPDDLLLLAVEV